MKVSMIGTGYVGLVSGVCFAEIGHQVTCIDINKRIIETLNKGESPIFEPGLSDLITKNLREERISFTTEFSSIRDAQTVFLGVGTPSAPDGTADLSYLKSAAISVAKEIGDETIIVIKSTVPVGTHLEIEKLISEHTSKKFYIVNNPEFLKEGDAIDDFMKPDRVIIGCKDESAVEVMKELYGPLVRQGHPIHIMSNLSAEVTKYASNSMLATKISFINEIAKFCDLVGADIEEVRLGMSSDKRIGPHFIYSGPGYGGSCFPKDVKALIHTAKKYDLNMQVVNAVEQSNDLQKTYMFEKILKHFNGDIIGKTFTFWGVSFKPNTDDIRESPAIYMARKLTNSGAKVKFFDPEASENFINFMNDKENLISCNNKYDALNDSDGLVVMTEWLEFRAPDLAEIKSRLKSLNVFDTRNLYNIKKMKELGFSYYAIGRKI